MESEILENIRMLVGTTDGEMDELIEFYAKDTIDAVLKYCRIDVVPRQLYGLIAQIAADMCAAHENGGNVKSVTEGERRVEFESGEELNSVFESYALRLEPFVNKSARLPSDTEVRDEER